VISPLERACAALEVPILSICAALAHRKGEVSSARRVLFASPRHGDGTTTVAACTALALCRTLGATVALVEANPFHATLASFAGCTSVPGFVDVLRGNVSIARALQQSLVPGLSMLPAGTLRAEAPLDWRAARERLLEGESLSSVAFTLFDAPPLLDRPVGRLLLELADAAVLVVRAGTTKDDARAAFQILTGSGVASVAVVLNRYRR
jgi:Mrp family chromosome partitioning ATPase